MKYKIKLTCYDFGNHEPYDDEVDIIYDDRRSAMIDLLRCVIEEADSLNNTFLNGEMVENSRYFQIDLDSDADAVIRCWDGLEDYSIVTIYNIEEVE